MFQKATRADGLEYPTGQIHCNGKVYLKSNRYRSSLGSMGLDTLSSDDSVHQDKRSHSTDIDYSQSCSMYGASWPDNVVSDGLHPMQSV